LCAFYFPHLAIGITPHYRRSFLWTVLYNTDSDQLAYYAVRLLEIAAEMRPHGKRALKLSRDDAWDIRTELLTVISRLTDVQARLMDREPPGSADISEHELRRTRRRRRDSCARREYCSRAQLGPACQGGRRGGNRSHCARMPSHDWRGASNALRDLVWKFMTVAPVFAAISERARMIRPSTGDDDEDV